jgi:nitric oxide reductase large subunit
MSQHSPKINDPKKYWLDDSRNVRKIIIAIFVVCAGLFAADAFYNKHPHFAAEEWFGFYAIYGFVMCVGLVLAAKLMRVFLMRDEGYYDKDE